MLLVVGWGAIDEENKDAYLLILTFELDIVCGCMAIKCWNKCI